MQLTYADLVSLCVVHEAALFDFKSKGHIAESDATARFFAVYNGVCRFILDDHDADELGQAAPADLVAETLAALLEIGRIAERHLP